MAPHIEVGRDGEREAVVLLRNVRASNGQEFLAGWRCGFTPSTAAFLVEQGWATRPEPQRVEVLPGQVLALAPEPAGVQNVKVDAVGYVGVPTVSSGVAPAADVEPAEPSQSKPTTSSRRRK